MFSSISWHQYWQFIAIACFIYYAALMILYRRRWLRYIIGEHPKKSAKTILGSGAPDPIRNMVSRSMSERIIQTSEMATSNIEGADISEVDSETEEDKFSDVNLDHIEWITNSLSDGMSDYPSDGNKEELILKLAQILRSDPKLSEIEPFREALDWHISQQARSLCQIELQDADNNRIWKMATENS